MSNHFETNGPIAQLLGEIADICEHASLTGAFDGGAARVARRYNSILEQLQSEGRIPDGMFEPVEPTAGYGEVGVEARMLRSFLNVEGGKRKRKDSDPDLHVLTRLAPFVRREDLGELIEAQMRTASVSLEDLVRLAPFLPESTINQIMADHMKGRPTAPEPPTPPAPPESAPTPPPPATPVPPGGFGSLPMASDMAGLLEALRWNELSEDVRVELMEQLQRRMRTMGR